MKKTRILIADDDFQNRKLFKFNLEESGYEVETAEDGQEALDKIEAFAPDAILMDIMMPVLDGISACKLIKGNKHTKDIPIIIVSAKNSTVDIINGLKAGADEYLTKPFFIEELYLRVNSVVNLKKTHDKLKNINSKLEEDIKRKSEQLLEASRFELIGKMACGIGHDLNNLLTGIIGYNNLANISKDNKSVKHYLEKQNASLDLCQNFVRNLLNFSRVQKPKLTLFDPKNAINTTLGILSGRIKRALVVYEVVQETETTIYGDEGHFNQICLNIISNAIDAMPLGGKLTIRVSADGDKTAVSFSDTGTGVKQSDKEKIFDYLYSTKEQNKSTGIGLYITKKIVEALNGKIELISEEGIGSTFNILLPSKPEKEDNINQTCP